MRLPFGLSLARVARTESFVRPDPMRRLTQGSISSRQASNGTTPAQPVTGKTGSSDPVIPIVVSLAGFFFLVWILYRILKSVRQKHGNSKYIPTKYLKQRWEAWSPGQRSKRSNSSQHLEPISESSSLHNPPHSPSSRPHSSFNTAANDVVRQAEEGTGARVDRNTSVRSVLTLPAYMASPGESEQVLGREGERAGIDVVIEYPETVSQIEEQRRDEEMEALYQVRLARRTEAAEREELRRLRREARERNDVVALEELRARGRASSAARATRTLEELREEHARLRDRPRAVSSVSYGDLGVASHDGTRIRSNSQESERPLLGDAASMASSRHRRDRSASSVLSIDSDFPSPSPTRSRANSRDGTSILSVRRHSANQSVGAMSSPELVDAENEDFSVNSPPEYEDIALQDGQPALTRAVAPAEPPPDYSSPVQTRPPELEITTATTEQRRLSRGVGGVPQLPSLRLASLPSIVVDAATPVNTRRSEDQSR